MVFSCLCHHCGIVTAIIVHRSKFFPFFQTINHLNLNQNLDRLVIDVNKFLKLPNLHMLVKQKILSRNVAVGTFGELLIMLSTKVNLLYLLYLTSWRSCLLHLIKKNYLLKTFIRTLI